MRLSVNGIASRLFPRDPSAAVLESDAVVLTTRVGELRLLRSAVRRVTATRGLFWDTLRIEPASGSTLTLRGLPRGAAVRASRAWQAQGLAPLAAATAAAFRALLDRDAYANRHSLDEWRTRTARWAPSIPPDLEALPLPGDVTRDLTDCREYLAHAERLVDARNDEYVRRKQREHATWFAAAGGSYPLTDEQQEAVLRDEDNCLVVAGAGTGKTSTVAGKVGYLLHSGAARPEQILLLSFTRKAATEMAERIARTVGTDAARHIRATTFHALGVDILAVADGVRPSVSKYAEDPVALGTAIAGYLASMLEDPATRAVTMEFLSVHQFPYRSPFEFASAHEYHQYVRDHELRTLKGELVRSHEELTIANWLFMHGVAYEYERPYEHETATMDHREYRPDFYLPDHRIYLEHFGVNRAGEAPKWMNPERYRAEMAWKRAKHQEFGTRLIETFSWERMEGVLLANLEAKLRAAGVVSRAPSPGELLAAAQGQRLVDPLATLLATFLKLFKGNLWTVAELEQAARHPVRGSRLASDGGRAVAFLRVFRHVLARYQAELEAKNEIDFEDMIASATEQVTSGRFSSPWKYVIVDEFQDLSRGRGQLLSALLAQVPDRRLFCVGDDWQSIYRFTGSDIEQMTAFADRFGFTRRCDLTRTHRFNQELLAASSAFVQANPRQLRKSLRAGRRLGAPAIEVVARQPDEGAAACLDRSLERVAAHAAREWTAPSDGGRAKPTVLLLGRYNATKPGDWHALTRRHPGLALGYLTVHRAKGLEADYAVVLDVTSGRMGFPSEVVDDPVLDLVLAGAGAYPNEEERRVFYVALTRARHRCMIVTDAARRSRFVEEIEGDAYRTWVALADTSDGAAPTCPTCGGGRLLKRRGRHGAFWGCSNYPLCEGKARLCPVCRVGAMVRSGEFFHCCAPPCAHVEMSCPACRVGTLVRRQGAFGEFLGCSEWRPAGAGLSCGYTHAAGGRHAVERDVAERDA